MFIIVTSFEFLIQIFIVQFGYGIFHCVKGGLSFSQWKISILFSLTTFLFIFIIKCVPLDKKINSCGKKEDLKDEINKLNPLEIELESVIDEGSNKKYIKKYLLQ